jgi:hypothetical protein
LQLLRVTDMHLRDTLDRLGRLLETDAAGFGEDLRGLSAPLRVVGFVLLWLYLWFALVAIYFYAAALIVPLQADEIHDRYRSSR